MADPRCCGPDTSHQEAARRAVAIDATGAAMASPILMTIGVPAGTKAAISGTSIGPPSCRTTNTGSAEDAVEGGEVKIVFSPQTRSAEVTARRPGARLTPASGIGTFDWVGRVNRSATISRQARKRCGSGSCEARGRRELRHPIGRMKLAESRQYRRGAANRIGDLTDTRRCPDHRAH
jgi:hypothetical protein